MSEPSVQPSDLSPLSSRHSQARRPIAGLLGIIAWAGVAAQIIGLIYTGWSRHWPAAGVLNGFFAYFTNLTNVFVAVLLTLHAVAPRQRRGRISASVDASAVVYIALVGIVNAIMLRGVWNPHGWFLVGDLLCHVILPISYPIYWLLLIEKIRLPWGDALRWLAYPAAFGVISVVRGMIIHWYPYPFFNVDKQGRAAVVLVLLFLGASIVLFSSMIIALDRALCGRSE